MDNIRASLEARGWKPGSVLPRSMLAAALPYLQRPGVIQTDVSDNDWLILLSHPCDLLAFKLEAEPFVEVLHCKALGRRPKPEFKNLRSTRVIEFLPNTDTHPEFALGVHAAIDRHLLPRELLTQHAPDPKRVADDNTVRRLARWLSLRLVRPSWPDEFVTRTKPAQVRLVAALEAVKAVVAEVRVALSPSNQELATDRTYSIVVYFVVDQLTWEGDPEVRSQINVAFAGFVSALSACPGIQVDMDRSCVVSGEDFTYDDIQRTDEWNFANLTYQMD